MIASSEVVAQNISSVSGEMNVSANFFDDITEEYYDLVTCSGDADENICSISNESSHDDPDFLGDRCIIDISSISGDMNCLMTKASQKKLKTKTKVIWALIWKL